MFVISKTKYIIRSKFMSLEGNLGELLRGALDILLVQFGTVQDS